ncbi:hypothetical protein [Saccharothrix sp. HUAS TT1]|uniref:hypothetical protein n=1 Tax=unclassified Saccharothrix TaxID=2593673 RepID=UPI00345B905D
MTTRKTPFAEETSQRVLALVAEAHPDLMDRVRALRAVRAAISAEIKNQDPKAVAEGLAAGMNDTNLGTAIGASHSHASGLRKALTATPDNPSGTTADSVPTASSTAAPDTPTTTS